METRPTWGVYRRKDHSIVRKFNKWRDAFEYCKESGTYWEHTIVHLPTLEEVFFGCVKTSAVSFGLTERS